MAWLSVAFFIDLKIGLGLTIAWLIRIYFLKIPKLVWVNLGVALLASLFLGWNVHEINHQTLDSTRQQALVLTVQPDSLKLNGDSLSGQAKIVGHRQPFIFFGYLRRTNELKAITNLNRTSQWRVNADVNSIDSPTNVNQFNAKQYYQSVGITNSIKINQINSIRPLHRLRVTDWIHEVRQILLRKANHLPHSLSVYVRSLILGDTNEESSPDLNGMKQLGLIHLFSISGFHVYYLISFLELLLIYLHMTRERYRVLIALILPIYFVFAGSSVGLLRSILMVEIGLNSRIFKHHFSSLDIWSLALLLNLLIQPRSLVQFGCQLSYALSLALIYTRRFHFFKQTIMMNLVSLPFILYNLYDWHVLTILANLLLLPLFSALVFPVVIIGAVGAHFLPVLGTLASDLLYYFDGLVNAIGRLPGDVRFGKPNVYGLIIVLFLTLKLMGRYRRRWLVMLLVLYSLMLVLIHYPINGEVTYFDVGQGDSFLIRQPFNRSVTVIDTGGRLQFGKQQTSYQADRTSINYLKSQGIYRIDNLCISHQDFDHCGDVPAFLQELRVKHLVIPWGMERNRNFMHRVRPNLGATQLIPVKSGMQVDQLPFRVLHPFHAGLGTNADSMVLEGFFDHRKWLFTGDLDQKGELDVLNHFPGLTADVLKLGHHGSQTASAPEFLDRLKPKVAIVSAGRHNRYHHPDRVVIDRLKRRRIMIYNTQNRGMISYHFGSFSHGWSSVRKG